MQDFESRGVATCPRQTFCPKAGVDGDRWSVPPLERTGSFASRHAIRQSRTVRAEGFPALPWDDDLRVEQMAAVGAGRRSEPAAYPASDRGRHQFFRYCEHVLVRRERRGPGPRVEGLRAGTRTPRDRNEGLLS